LVVANGNDPPLDLRRGGLPGHEGHEQESRPHEF
jgi:hypothetical protein